MVNVSLTLGARFVHTVTSYCIKKNKVHGRRLCFINQNYFVILKCPLSVNNKALWLKPKYHLSERRYMKVASPQRRTISPGNGQRVPRHR